MFYNEWKKGVELESDLAGVSASAKKLKLSDKDFDVNNQFGYRIIHFLAVFP